MMVYVLTFDVRDDDDQMIDGRTSVHATMASAEHAMVALLSEYVPASGIMPVTVGNGHRIGDAGSDGAVYRRLVDLGVKGYVDAQGDENWAAALEISAGIVNDDSHCADLFDGDVSISYGINRMTVEA
jgi:hypothetical protein